MTALFGPLVSLNVLIVLAPALAAWSAFLLCRHLAKSWWAALLGGYVFGFSSYMLEEEWWGDLHTTVVFLVPLAVLAVIRAIPWRSPGPGDGGIANCKFILLLAAILVTQFLISTEIFASMTILGAMALALGWLFAPTEAARRLAKTALLVLGAYVAAMVIVSPYLYWMFVLSFPRGEIFSIEQSSADTLAFFLPSAYQAIDKVAPFSYLATHEALFLHRTLIQREFWWSNPAYMALPLLAIAADHGRRNWGVPLGKVLFSLFIIIIVLSMGPQLRFMKTPYFALPGKLLFAMPLLNKMLPYRLMMYAFLCLAVITALWFGTNGLRKGQNLLVATLIVLTTMPRLSYPWWAHAANEPLFFRSGIYRQYLTPGENVLVLPMTDEGDEMLWQAEANMHFRMLWGFAMAVSPPAGFDLWLFLQGFRKSDFMPDTRRHLAALLARHHVDTIVVADSERDAANWNALFSNFAAAEAHVGGVTIYRIAPSALAGYRTGDASQMR